MRSERVFAAQGKSLGAGVAGNGRQQKLNGKRLRPAS
jgi:hypothetical protein